MFGDDHFKNFDKHFNRTRKVIFAWFIMVTLISLAVMGFAGWVIVKLFIHFGVI